MIQSFSFHRMRIYFLAIMACIVLSTQASGMSEDMIKDIQINISQLSNVKADQLVLSNIASIESKEFLKEAIGNISLGKAPKPGKILQFKKERLIRLIKANHLIKDSTKIICPDQVYIKRNAQSLENDFIRESVMTYLKNRFSPRNFEILSMNIRGSKNYPEGNLELVPGSRCFISNNGRLSLSMNVLVDDTVQGRITVNGRVAEFESLLCAARYIEKGTAIKPDDICFEKKNIMSLRVRGIKNMDNIIGQTLTFPVRKGQIIDPEKLVPASLIKKGEIVTLLVAKNNLRILTPGICTEEGFVNQPVQVENITSGKKVRGILRKDSTVEVFY